MNAAPIIANAVGYLLLRLDDRDDDGSIDVTDTEAAACQAAGQRAIEHLRAACGGGDIVIRTDGTLWRSVRDAYPAEWPVLDIAPVERGA